MDAVEKGLRILVLHQSPDTWKAFGFEVQDRASRTLFLRDGQSAALARIDDDCLHDWSGASPELRVRHPRHEPRWTGNMSLAALQLKSPVAVGYRPQIDGEFDMNYSAIRITYLRCYAKTITLYAVACVIVFYAFKMYRSMLRYAGVDTHKAVGALSERELAHAAAACKDFRLPLRGTEGFDNAQVTAGGLRTADFDPGTMQSRLVPGLYVCGELLDVDGDCGGFNLQWAWASGRLAGRLL